MSNYGLSGLVSITKVPPSLINHITGRGISLKENREGNSSIIL